MKKYLLSILLVFALVTSMWSAVALEYSDIRGHWAEGSILESNFTGVFPENEDFSPNTPITRMEFCRMLHTALGINIAYFAAPDINEIFTDVQNDAPGAVELYNLVTTGIVTESDLFRPDDPLRRDEMIHYVISALNYKTDGNYAIIMMMPAPFEDDADITEAYKNDIIHAVLLKIVKGRGNNMLYPAAAATRAEAVTVIERLLTTIRNLARVDVYPEATVNDDFIEMKLTIENNTKDPVTINYNSGQHFDFQLFDAEGNSLYLWSEGKMFTMALTSTVINPGEKLEHTATLDGDAYAAIKDKIHSMKAYITGTSESFNVNPDGYEYLP